MARKYPTTRICTNCGNPFQAYVLNKITCSRECANARIAVGASLNAHLRVKHGHAMHGEKGRSREYQTWDAIIQRTTNPKTAEYFRYGGRGITMCDEWRSSFPAFLAHVGPRPSSRHSIERIDNSRGYEPGNVRWATPAEQNRNMRSNVNLTIDGVTRCLMDWSEISGINYETIRGRLRRGLEPKAAVFTPTKKGHGKEIATSRSMEQ